METPINLSLSIVVSLVFYHIHRSQRIKAVTFYTHFGNKGSLIIWLSHSLSKMIHQRNLVSNLAAMMKLDLRMENNYKWLEQQAKKHGMLEQIWLKLVRKNWLKKVKLDLSHNYLTCIFQETTIVYLCKPLKNCMVTKNYTVIKIFATRHKTYVDLMFLVIRLKRRKLNLESECMMKHVIFISVLIPVKCTCQEKNLVEIQMSATFLYLIIGRQKTPIWILSM